MVQRTDRANANLDALLQTAADTETEERPGFFSRLFGRGRNSDANSAGAAATQWADVTPDTTTPASAPSTPMAFSPVVETEHRATPRAPMFSAPSAAEPTPVQPPVTGSAPAAPASAASWEAPAQGFVPASEPEPASAPEEPSVPSWQSAPAPAAPSRQPAPMATSLHAPAPWEREDGTAQKSFTPQPTQEPGQRQTSFTPDELADATGWQAAGASALQAAQPEVATSYQPIIQPEEGGGDGDADVTSAVFSEFSSLATERPKVEKTRAGLERRRPTNAKPVEIKPIKDSVTITPAKRDADEIRKRFSSFYSGTQRARDDVATHDRRAQTTEVSDT